MTPSDGLIEGTYADASITISNTAPSVDDISIVPTNPNTNDTVSCAVTVTDPDNESLTETYAWINTSTGTTIEQFF